MDGAAAGLLCPAAAIFPAVRHSAVPVPVFGRRRDAAPIRVFRELPERDIGSLRSVRVLKLVRSRTATMTTTATMTPTTNTTTTMTKNTTSSSAPSRPARSIVARSIVARSIVARSIAMLAASAAMLTGCSINPVSAKGQLSQAVADAKSVVVATENGSVELIHDPSATSMQISAARRIGTPSG
jgi:hypothetical protein